jgi:hypothetical protein
VGFRRPPAGDARAAAAVTFWAQLADTHQSTPVAIRKPAINMGGRKSPTSQFTVTPKRIMPSIGT